MVTVYLVHGFLGVGKTTLAKLIGEHAQAVRFSADEWYIELFGQNSQRGIDPLAEMRMRNLMWRHWPAVVSAGADVILDMGFWTRADRDRSRQTCRELGADLVVIEVVAERDVAIRRCLSRNEAPTAAFFVDEQIYTALSDGFEPLDGDEARVTFRT